jgi:hypothetical protein
VPVRCPLDRLRRSPDVVPSEVLGKPAHANYGVAVAGMLADPGEPIRTNALPRSTDMADGSYSSLTASAYGPAV